VDNKLNVKKYHAHFEVEIGGVYNGVRELTITGNGKTFVIYHDLTAFGSAIKKSSGNVIRKVRQIDVYFADNSFQGRYNSVNEACATLNVDSSSFYKWIKAGKIIVKVVPK
jgi:hypothetical protein